MNQNNVTEIKNRLIKYVNEYEKTGFRKFEKRMGFSDGLISRPGGFSLASLCSLAVNCEKLNIRWLLTGEGTMLEENKINQTTNNGSANQVAGTIVNNGDMNFEIEEVCDEVKSLRIIVKDLKKEIQRLQENERRLIDQVSEHSDQVNYLLGIKNYTKKL